MRINKLNKYIVIILAVIISSFGFSSCGEKQLQEIKEKIEDIVKEEQEGKKKDKEEKKEEPKEQPKQDNQEVPDNQKSNLIIMDFTGQDCAPCSALLESSIKRINNNQEFSKNVFFVSMHCFSNFSRDLYNPHSYEYSVARRINAVPYLTFDNTPGNKNPISDDNIRKAINAKKKMNTEVKAELTHNNSRVDITVKSNVIDDSSELKSERLNVLVWILENDVIARQIGISNTYNHQHVFRGYLGNNIWGEEYRLGESYNYKSSLPNKVKTATNCEVIVIILNAETKQFIDATRVKLK